MISSLNSLIFFFIPLRPQYRKSGIFYHIHIFFSPLRKSVDLKIANQKTTDDLTKVKGELATKDEQLETNKVQIEKLKSKNEDYEQEITR